MSIGLPDIRIILQSRTIINVILVIIIVAMFIILNTSLIPILLIAVNLQNKYAQWQEQLQSREQSLNARKMNVTENKIHL